MTKFKIVSKKINLSYLGDEWKDCYLEFSSLTFKDVKQMASLATEKNQQELIDKGLKILEDCFISGKALSDKGIVDVRKEDLGEFPVEVINKILTELTGQIDPKD